MKRFLVAAVLLLAPSASAFAQPATTANRAPLRDHLPGRQGARARSTAVCC